MLGGSPSGRLATAGPICGNVWQVLQVEGMVSFVATPFSTLKWPPSWQRKQPGQSRWPMLFG